MGINKLWFIGGLVLGIALAVLLFTMTSVNPVSVGIVSVVLALAAAVLAMRG